MPKIVWAGIIKNTAKYQKGKLPSNAIKLKLPRNIGNMMIAAMPFMILPMIIICGSMFLKTYLNHQVVVNRIFTFFGFTCGFISLLIHELLHAIVYPKEATVYIGIIPKNFVAVALASYPMKKNRFILMCILPIMLGIIPIAIFWFTPACVKELNGFLFGYALMGLISPYPDFYNIYQVIRQTPKQCKIQFEKDDMYYFEY